MDQHWTLPIAATAALALLWTLEGLAPMFERGPRGHARRNLALALINAAVASAFAGLTLGATELAAAGGFGVLRWVGASGVLAALGAIVLLDLWQYAFHVAAHKLPVLWRFHVVHHHDEAVEATSAMRFHAGEIAIQSLLALPVFMLLGVHIGHVLLYELIVVPIALFHHANIRMPERIDRPLRWLIVTPRMHWVHHSRWQPETDSNFSAVFSFWDRLFRTFRLRRDPKTIHFGIDGYDRRDHATLRGMLLTPFGPIKSEYGQPPQDPARRGGGFQPARDDHSTQVRSDLEPGHHAPRPPHEPPAHHRTPARPSACPSTDPA